MRKADARNVLREAGVTVDLPDFYSLSEEAQLKVADDTLMKMFKFVTDKYNSLDMSEIEKSAGDFMRFKYRDMMYENIEILTSIYQSSTDDGAKVYLDVIRDIRRVMDLLDDRRNQWSTLYKDGNGVVQLLYTSLVAGCLYAIGILISNTIRFVTTDQDADCQVMFDEIPGTMKHVHIKNIQAAAKSTSDIQNLLNEYSKNTAVVQESVTVSAVTVALLSTAIVIMLIPRILILVREIIYSIYYSRVKKAEMLDMQIQLLRTNIESLEAGRGNKKVIARQKKIADRLEKMKNKISLKMDTAELGSKQQKMKEARELHVDRNSPIMQDAITATAAEQGDILV